MLEPNKVFPGSSPDDVMRMLQRHFLTKLLRKLFGVDKKKNKKPRRKREGDKC